MATLRAIAQAKYPVEIFGNLEDPLGDKPRALALKYRKLRRETHPDVNGSSEMATRAFQNLELLKKQADLDLEHGIYGRTPVVTIQTKQHAYTILDLLGSLGAAHCYNCFIDKQEGVFTVARSPSDNDLLQAEAKVLKFLREPDRHEAAGYIPMLPDLVESFVYGEENGIERQANTFKTVPGYVSLAAVQKAYPGGIDARDMAWMWRRLLDVLGYAHRRGVFHGAVLLPNILIGTEDLHELILTNWQAAVGENAGTSKRIAYIDTAYKQWYPPEVMAKEPPTPGTDILMSARCMIALMGGDPVTGNLPSCVHRRIAAFLKSCLIMGIRQRPQDAWKLRSEFTELIEQLWGKRQYRPFMMPSQ